MATLYIQTYIRARGRSDGCRRTRHLAQTPPLPPIRLGTAAHADPARAETTTHTGEPMSNLTPEQLEAIAYIVLAFTGPPSMAYFLVKGLFK
ncbi:hypothetical protein FGG38_gp68 [Mycobacterium phage DotProduct]|uniref:Uncharacterized protein n=1 Tax=Mycobacterium phage DotProduct TaxID=2923008 RepID=G8J7S0_9CAUD|nr:hypothetical protein FGG38_gp68 [Mycobacterium phage DotProduct]AER14112.1 hypothetical protein DOTPRODUCT_68 [Mycobacterium phage DotProduct]